MGTVRCTNREFMERLLGRVITADVFSCDEAFFLFFALSKIQEMTEIEGNDLYRKYREFVDATEKAVAS